MTALAHALWLEAFYQRQPERLKLLGRHYFATSPLVALMWKDACR